MGVMAPISPIVVPNIGRSTGTRTATDRPRTEQADPAAAEGDDTASASPRSSKRLRTDGAQVSAGLEPGTASSKAQ